MRYDESTCFVLDAVRNVSVGDAEGEPLRDGSLPYAGLTDQYRVVLRPPREHLRRDWLTKRHARARQVNVSERERETHTQSHCHNHSHRYRRNRQPQPQASRAT
jgi:hypothetical protein